MPNACVFICLALPGVVLLAPALIIAAVVRRGGRKRVATAIAAIPLGMIGLAALFTILTLALSWFYGIHMSSHPDLLFKKTFQFAPPSETQVLNGYCDLGSDFGMTVLKFRTTKDVIDKIIAGRFTRSDRRTCLWDHENGYSNMPENVLSWFLPPQVSSIDWYTMKGFDGTFGHDEAILGYDKDTQTAYFYWCGVD